MRFYHVCAYERLPLIVASSFVEISAFSPFCIVQIIATHRPVKYFHNYFMQFVMDRCHCVC